MDKLKNNLYEKADNAANMYGEFKQEMTLHLYNLNLSCKGKEDLTQLLNLSRYDVPVEKQKLDEIEKKIEQMKTNYFISEEDLIKAILLDRGIAISELELNIYTEKVGEYQEE